jgi:hypothetical protein
MDVMGTWRITAMGAPAHITLRDDLTGTFQFGLVQGDIDARVGVVDGVARVVFSWSGVDENDPVSGRGWLDVTGDPAQGHIFVHLGDDSAFAAVRAG